MKKTRLLASLFSVGALALTACSASDSTATGGGADGEGLTIVASTSIWGDVASAVVTDPGATITPIIEGNAVDPHHFEPSAADLARAHEADIVVVGGGGYDAWLYDVVDEDKIVHALPLTQHSHGDEAHGHDHGDHAGHDHGPIEAIDGNEHIWYDTDAVEYVAEEIEAAARAIDPEIAADAEPVVKRMDAMDQLIAELPSASVTQSETVADYIIHDSQLRDVTPDTYRAAMLSESEPAAADLAAFLDVLAQDDVSLLIFNPQTATDTAGRIRSAAEDNNVTVVELNETPEAGVNFLDYFEERVNALSQAAA